MRGNPSVSVRARGILRRTAKQVIHRLPSPRDRAALRAAVALRDLVTGRDPAPKTVRARRGRDATAPSRPKPPPLPDRPWLFPDNVTGSGSTDSRLPQGGSAPPIRFDVELLEQLNREYADRPLVPKPPAYDATSLAESARRRVGWVHGMVDLLEKKTLEIGCGNGFEVWSLAHNLGCDAYGVDIAKYAPWDQLAGDRVHFEQADISRQSPFESNSFDRIISFTVWEHVSHPFAMLQAAYDVLKPGGIAWIRANLYAGPQASHRYRDIYFPWPHLLFTDEVIREWDRKHGREPRGHAWVNRLSSLHYDHYVKLVGFEVLSRTFTETPIDEDFYRRFEDVVGRYPRTDLMRDYILLVLRKPK